MAAAQKGADSLAVTLPGHGLEGEPARTADTLMACLAAFSEAVSDRVVLPT